MSLAGVRVSTATQPSEVEQVRGLVLEYAAALGVDLGFQDFARELREFPGNSKWRLSERRGNLPEWRGRLPDHLADVARSRGH